MNLNRRRRITNRWTGATGSDFRIKLDPAKLLGNAVARSTQALDFFSAQEMRDNHEGMPEIVDAFEKDGQYFGVVAIARGDRSKQFRFGVSLDGYRALRKILQLRPFDSMPGLKHRHFFALSYGKIPGSSDYKTDIRVEQGRDGKKLKTHVPKDLLTNLVWFSEIKGFDEAAHLPEVT